MYAEKKTKLKSRMKEKQDEQEKRKEEDEVKEERKDDQDKLQQQLKIHEQSIDMVMASNQNKSLNKSLEDVNDKKVGDEDDMIDMGDDDLDSLYN